MRNTTSARSVTTSRSVSSIVSFVAVMTPAPCRGPLRVFWDTLCWFARRTIDGKALEPSLQIMMRRSLALLAFAALVATAMPASAMSDDESHDPANLTWIVPHVLAVGGGGLT